MQAGVTVHEKNFHKNILPAEQLVAGCNVLKYEDGDVQVTPVKIGVDSNGFFVFWKDQHHTLECLDLAFIRDTRIGERKSRLSQDPKLLQSCLIGTEHDAPLEEKCMTLVYGNSYVNLRFISFIFEKPSGAHLWANALFQLAYNYKTQCLSLERTLMKIHTRLKIISSPEGEISVKDVIEYFHADKDDQRQCEMTLESHKNDPIFLENFHFNDFVNLFLQIVPQSDLEQVFVSLTAETSGKYLTAGQLRNFLNRTQRDPRLNEILHPLISLESACLMIRKYEPQESFRTNNWLSQEGFTRLLMSDSSSIVSPSCYNLHQDMNRPFGDYFVNSSHNTYLIGPQIKGRSRSEMYRQVLLSGCRCVELDCWNGDDGEPIITHGRSLTSSIPVQEALEAIADYAFKTSDYPVVLSIENHCSARLQDKLAQYLKKAFGPALLDLPLTSHALEPGVTLPSPEQLKNRILIKNKKHANTTGQSMTISETDDHDLTEERVADDSGDENDIVTESMVVVVEEENNQQPTSPRLAPLTPTVESQLSALVTYVQPIQFDSFEAAKKRNRGYECVSFKEHSAMQFVKRDPVDFIEFNKRQLTRVYPHFLRVSSSNFNPFMFWSAGCQMVALNFQTPDLGMQLNTSVFEINGRSGYLLKPELMHRKDRTLDPFTKSHLDGVVPALLSVKILSGLMLSFKSISSYVSVSIYGIFADISKNYKTRVCLDNGINPLYGVAEQPFVFRLSLPEMAYVRICAREDRTGRLIGHALLPVNQISPGYRHVMLRNEIGQTLPATIFVFIDIRDYIPTDQTDLADALENPIQYQNEYYRTKKLDELVNNGTDPEDLTDNELEGNNDPELCSTDSKSNSVIGKMPLIINIPKKVKEPSSPPNRSPGLNNHIRLESTHSGTSLVERASLVPSDFDDLAAFRALQEVKTQSVEDLQKTTKNMQKLRAKQDKELQQLHSKYFGKAKHIEALRTKERGKVARACETQFSGISGAVLLRTAVNEQSIRDSIKSHQSDRCEITSKQDGQLIRLRREFYTREFELKKQYQEMLYQMQKKELEGHRTALRNWLQSVHDANVSKMLKKNTQQTAQELLEVRTQRPPLSAAEIDRRQVDIAQKSVRQGVSIAKKYEIMFADRNKVLAEEMDLKLERIAYEKTQVDRDLEKQFQEKCNNLDTKMRCNYVTANVATDHED